MTTEKHVIPETQVPADETPAARCPYCDRPFRSERRRALHVGSAHEDRCTAAERDAAAAAAEAETDELFVYHLKVIAALVSLYAGLVILYMVVLSGG